MIHRTGLLGGTFDPPHAGHLVMASTARDALGLTRVFLVPAVNPPHKSPTDVTPFTNRVEMARLAADGVPGVEVAAIEDEPGEMSWTVDLLTAARDRFGRDLYFIVGADSLNDLPAWREPRRILELCTLVVFAREGRSLRLPVEGDARVVVFENPQIDVSSSHIRDAMRAGRDCGDHVAGPVARYVRENALYVGGERDTS